MSHEPDPPGRPNPSPDPRQVPFSFAAEEGEPEPPKWVDDPNPRSNSPEKLNPKWVVWDIQRRTREREARQKAEP